MIDFELLDTLTPLPPQDLPRQWRVATAPDPQLDSWVHLASGSWHLQAHPAAQVSVALDRNGSEIGWIIGAIGGERTTTDGSMRLDIGPACANADIERALYGRGPDERPDGTGLQGPWTAIIVNGQSRVFVAAAHSVLFSPEERCVATSPSLFKRLVRDRELCDAVNPRITKSFYGFGLTPYRGIGRLLPNHALDLDAFVPKRHWPLAGLEPYDTERGSADRLIAGTESLLADIVSQFDNVQISLSAGRDSRAVLALSRTLIAAAPGKVSAFTTRGGDQQSRMDAATAAILAGRAGIAHDIRMRGPKRSASEEKKSASEEEIARSFIRFGEAKWGPILTSAAASVSRNASPSGARNAPATIHLPGMAGETARSFYWDNGMPNPSDVEPAALVRRVGLPAVPKVVNAAANWLEGLPDAVRVRPHDILDLLYVEQRLGCWDAPARYLFRKGGMTFNLMSTTLALDSMLRLDPEIRKRGSFQETLVELAWPALADLPYNQAFGRQRFGVMAERGYEMALRVGRRLRAEAISALASGRSR